MWRKESSSYDPEADLWSFHSSPKNKWIIWSVPPQDLLDPLDTKNRKLVDLIGGTWLDNAGWRHLNCPLSEFLLLWHHISEAANKFSSGFRLFLILCFRKCSTRRVQLAFSRRIKKKRLESRRTGHKNFNSRLSSVCLKGAGLQIRCVSCHLEHLWRFDN